MMMQRRILVFCYMENTRFSLFFNFLSVSFMYKILTLDPFRSLLFSNVGWELH